MEQQLNREIVRIATISNNNGRTAAEQQEHRDKIKLVDFLLSENTVPKILSIPLPPPPLPAIQHTDPFNTNLFYHGWLFPEALDYTNRFIIGTDEENATRLNITKYPYIGLFHPFGSIYAINNQWQGENVPLNNLASISQNFHDAFSPPTSYIHIDRNNDGKAYTVCVDWDETNRPGVRLAQMRGIVTLLIYISNTSEVTPSLSSRTKYDEIQNSLVVHNTGSVGILLESLSRIKGLYKILNTWEIDLFKQKATINKSKIFGDGLLLFDYGAGSDKSKVYMDIIKIKLDIIQDNIPYIDEIKSKLPPTIFTPAIISNITWEFEIQIYSI
jgi:hypothetical protein